MKTTIYGQDARVLDFMAEHLADCELPADSVTLGVESGGELIAGVAFENYTKTGISIHVAALEGRHWLSKDFLFRVFAYPFLQLSCHRVTGLVRIDNLKAQKLDEHLGFVQEGIIRRGATDGTDFIMYGMLKEECRWIKVQNG
jgi:RimJ/RimL family protein N-acetyltransferase